jgi:sarcosine oxidase subunit gamma
MAVPGTTHPADCLRRSFIYRNLEKEGANFTEVNGAAVAADFGTPDAEATAVHRMAIADLSPLPRVGVKGRGALEWARNQGVAIPDLNNMARRQRDGALGARLADTELLVLDGLDGTGALPHRLESGLSTDAAAGTYPVNRQAASFWFLMCGMHGAGMFAKLCAVDLRPDKFPDGAVAQTSVARTSCIVIRSGLGDVPAWHLLGDSASAEYLWECLADAMGEFGGRPIGLDVLCRTGSTTARP